jgi:uncharacterized repeat protein (TIGR01451 family)
MFSLGKVLPVAAIVAALTLSGGCNMLNEQGDTGQPPRPQTSAGFPRMETSDTATVPPTRDALVLTQPAPAPQAVERAAQPAASERPAVLEVRAPAAQPMPSTDGWIRGRLAYPTGEAATSAVLLEKSMPAEVISGKPYEYELKVTNISKMKLEGVEVVEAIPAALKISEPAGGTMRDGSLRFNVGILAPGESKTMRLGATPGSGGQIGTCSSVSYNTTLCLSTNVVSPAIKLVKSMPNEVMVCDEIPIKFTVTNTGTGMARNVKIEENFPTGMTTVDGRPTIAIDAGNLGAGESKTLSLNAKVSKTGQYTNKATARAENGLTSDSAPVSVTVRQPVLAITKTGPQKQFIGRPVTFEINVTNKGDGIARDLVVTDSLPADVKFESATEGGRSAAGKVQWALGELAPGASKKLSVTLSGHTAGVLKNDVTAQARCAQAVTASAQTSLGGIPALLLECVDVTDPIEVGENQTYVITVTNQGSADDTNIKIVANLEDTMEFVSAGGATRSATQGKTITFEPLPKLSPKAKAEWKVVVKAVNQGDVRFKVDMNSDQLTRPVAETESSNFYK